MDTLLTRSIPIIPSINHLIPTKRQICSCLFFFLKKRSKTAVQSVKSITKKGQNDQSCLKTHLNLTFRTKIEITVMKRGMGEDV